MEAKSIIPLCYSSLEVHKGHSTKRTEKKKPFKKAHNTCPFRVQMFVAPILMIRLCAKLTETQIVRIAKSAFKRSSVTYKLQNVSFFFSLSCK